MSFIDLVDRIAVLGQKLTEVASKETRVRSRYADALIEQPLSAYVREAEAVESRMFTVQQPPPGELPSAAAVDLKRQDAVSATPLKKARDAPLALLEPEEYIRSVLRLGEKYKVMPRAQAYARELLERSEYLQKRIPELEQAYEDALVNSGAIPKGTPKSAIRTKTRTLKEEERLTREAEARVAILRDKRDNLLKRINNQSATESATDTSVFTSPSAFKITDSSSSNLLEEQPAASTTSKRAARPAPPLATRKPATAQDLAARRQARMDARKAAVISTQSTTESSTTDEENVFWGGAGSAGAKSGKSAFVDSLEPSADSSIETSDTEIDSEKGGREAVEVAASSDDDGDGDGDTTVVLPSKAAPARRTFSLLRHSTTRASTTNNAPLEPPPAAVPALSSPPTAPITVLEVADSPQIPVLPSSPPRLPSETSPETTSEHLSGAGHVESDTSATLNTHAEISPEVEIQLAYIWKTVGDTLVPDNIFSKDGAQPTAKLILSMLEKISTQPSPPTSNPTPSDITCLTDYLSPYTSAPSSTAVILSRPPLTPIQIRIFSAYAATQLLNADGMVMQLSVLKERMKNMDWAKTSDENGASVDWANKTVFHCIAKKLINVSRREGLVRFGNKV